MELTNEQLGLIKTSLQEKNIRLKAGEYRLLSFSERNEEINANKELINIISKEMKRVKL